MTTIWTGAEAYEQLMGRWSRSLAPLLITFAGVEDSDRVLDVGCGTGSLSAALLDAGASQVVGLDPSTTSVEYARGQWTDPRARFEVGDAQSLPFADASFDRCLSLLVLNFVPDAPAAVAEMRRVTRPGGTIAAAVWDYGGEMQMLRILWDAAASLNPDAEASHERNMPYCRRGQLAALWKQSGLENVEEAPLEISQQFTSFEDYWAPFLSGIGPSGSYVSALPPDGQAALRDRVRGLLPGGAEGPFTLRARAWGVRGTVPAR